MESREFNFKSLVDLILSQWKTFLIVLVLGGVVGVVISMPSIMVPRFKSVAVVYPVNLVLYSDESETEQLLQVFESSSVRDSVIAKFDLYSRYDIDPDAAQSRFYLLEEYSDRFTASKTMYESVRLEVYDEDPVVAQAMADEVLRQVNAKFNLLANERGRNLARSYKRQMDYQATVVDSIEALVAQISTEKGIMDYEAQTRELLRGYINASKAGNSNQRDQIEGWLQGAQESGSTVKMLQNVSEWAVEQRSDVEAKYLFWREFAFRDINYIDVIVSPEVADKKAWPVRWLVVAVSMLSAMLLALVLVALGKSKAHQ